MEILKYYDVISGMLLLTCVLTSASFIKNFLDPSKSRMAKAAYEFAGMVKNKQKRSENYARLDAWLKKNGASFHIGKNMDPGRFVTICAGMSIIGFLAGACISPAVSLLLGFCMALVLPAYIPAANRADNKEMLSDIKLIYHSLEVQISGGVYVTDALSECALSVRNERLISALNTFALDMMMKSDVYASLERFRASFDDRYIDSLCITVVQAFESGQAVELLSDIAEQVSDMEEDVLQAGKASLDRLLTLCQLLVLAAVMGTALYACVIYMMHKAVSF